MSTTPFGSRAAVAAGTLSAAIAGALLCGCATSPLTLADRPTRPRSVAAAVDPVPASTTLDQLAPAPTSAPVQTSAAVQGPAAGAASAPITPDPAAAATAAAVAVHLTSVAPSFGTPDDAMRYLVDAYNAHDIVSERHVTTPDSRASLENERQWVNTFRFNRCDSMGGGEYSCQFDMVSKVATVATAGSPSGYDAFGNDLQAMGEITVMVAPAAGPGWYMATNEGCGD